MSVMKKIFSFIILIFLFGGCSREIEQISSNSKEGVTVSFSFSLEPQTMDGIATKSTDPATIDDDIIDDIWAFQFSNSGGLVKKEYISPVNAGDFKVKLIPGNTGNLYFIVNAGPSAFTADPANEAALKSASKTITTESDFLNGTSVIMTGQVLNFTVPETGYPAKQTLPLTRAVSQLNVVYSVDPSILSTFKLEKIRLCNVPKTLQYLPPASGNFPAVPDDNSVLNLPWIDVTSSSTPQTLTYYIPDNRRGAGSNTTGNNPRLKTGLAYATYVEMAGHTIGVDGGDEMTYRIYPGGDNYNDYNVSRNAHYVLNNNLKGVSVSDNRVSFKERSNCYMLKPGQSVLIPVKHANDSNLGIQIDDVTSATGWTPSIYWQTAANLITVTDDSRSVGCFKVVANSAGTQGNAVVAIKNASGKVLWSWHIWITGYDPNASNDLLNGNTWMKVNLGATAVAGSGNNFDLSGGLFYQWGRKDPFPQSNTAGNNVAPIAINSFVMPAYSGMTTYPVTNDPYVKSADAAAAPVSYTNQLAYSVMYPMLFMRNWAGSTATAAASGTMGADSWGGEYGVIKCVYDPCPEGWRVPSGKRASASFTSPWGTFTALSSTGNYGTASSWVCWNSTQYYPENGYRDANGNCYNVGSATEVWSSTIEPSNGNANILQVTTSPSRLTSNRAFGQSVRCVKNWYWSN
jgi:hypothetical protein